MDSLEPEENGGRLNGDELDELKEEEVGTPPQPVDSENPDEEQSGKDDSGEPGGSEAEPTPRQQSALQRQKTHGARRWPWVVSAVLLCVLAGIGFLYIKQRTPKQAPYHERESPAAVRASVPQEPVVSFDSFVIPVSGNRKFTYIFLSISLKLPNKEVKRVMIERKSQLRGIIYEILAGEIRKSRELPPLDHLKGLIIRAVQGSLPTGYLGEVYITKFLAV